MRQNTYFVVWSTIGLFAAAGTIFTAISGPTKLWAGFLLVLWISVMALGRNP